MTWWYTVKAIAIGLVLLFLWPVFLLGFAHWLAFLTRVM